MKIPIFYKPNNNNQFILGENEFESNTEDFQHNEGGRKLSGYYLVDKNMLSVEFGLGKSNDVKIREFTVLFNGKAKDACVFYIDGLINKALLNDFILRPLMIYSRELKIEKPDEICDILLPQSEVIKENLLGKLSYGLNFGSAVILVNGMEKAALVDIKGWNAKAISEPTSEKVIRGPNDAFNEQLRSNTAMVRRLIRNRSLVIEETTVGKISQTPCSVMYMKNIADDKLVNEVKNRVENLDIDYIMSSAELEMFMEEKSYSAIPQFLSTERPDRTAKAILDGKVAVLIDGSPYALLMPTTIYELTESIEDTYLRTPYANMMRIIKTVAFLFSTLLPGFYIAIMNFHNELIPTNLLIAIIASKEAVPFPGVIELLLMEISLEIIREASIRVPTPSGSTLSIVGALILGQAAVEASIVSPVVIIIVSLSAIGSFTIPNYYLALGARVMKFVYIVLGSFAGLLGVSAGLFIQGFITVSTYSVGVPMLSPYAPKMNGGKLKGLFIKPIWKREHRDDYLNPKRKDKESEISRKWKK